MTAAQRDTGRVPAGWFGLATLTALGFVVAFLLDAPTPLLGLLLGVTFAAIAVALVQWAARLLPSRPHVEERPPMQESRQSRPAFEATAGRKVDQTPAILRRTAVLGGLGLVAALLVPLRSLLPRGLDPMERLTTTPWRRGMRTMTADGELVRVDDLAVGSFVTVFPEGMPEADDATAVLIVVDPGPADGGLLAFSKLCTHAGCPVGLYEQTTQQLFCPCHQSVFDVLDGARPVAGPAARPLPRLPVVVDESGYVVADGDFDGQVGPTVWRTQ